VEKKPLKEIPKIQQPASGEKPDSIEINFVAEKNMR
jgi:hypothetical protein